MMKMMTMLEKRMRRMMLRVMRMMMKMMLTEAQEKGQLKMMMMMMRMMSKPRSRKLTRIRRYYPAEFFFKCSSAVRGRETWSSSRIQHLCTHPIANFLEPTKTLRLYLLNKIL